MVVGPNASLEVRFSAVWLLAIYVQPDWSLVLFPLILILFFRPFLFFSTMLTS